MLPEQMNSFREEMEKQAILGSLALGAGLHVGANAAFKTLRSTHTGHQLEQSQFASGYQHALKGQKMNPVLRNVATYGVGPESVVHYDLGQALGKEMSGLSKGRRYRQLKKLRKSVALSPELQKAPMGKSLIGAVDKIILPQKEPGMISRMAGRVFKPVAANAKPTLGQKLVSGGLGAAAVAAEPHSAIHMGINATRKAIATSGPGRKFMKSQFMKGVRGEEAPGKLRQLATDLVVSPAALDTRRLGTALHSEVSRRGAGGAAKLVGSAMGLPGVRSKAISTGQRLLSTLPRFAP